MRPDRVVRKSLRERFLITMTNGEAFEGVLFDADQNTLHLVDAFLVDKSSRVRADGALFIPRASVSYMQKPGEVAG